MRSPKEIEQARAVITEACRFLLEQGESPAVGLTVELHAGILYALSWVLETKKSQVLEKHLEMLRAQLPQAVGGAK